MRKLTILGLYFVLAGICGAEIITVDDDAPADFNNIQAAIDDSNDGDIIEVRPGIYTGNGNRDIDPNGKAVTIRSIDPNDPNIVAATIIDCNGTEAEPHRGFYFHNQEDSNSSVEGLTVTNGLANEGGGFYLDDSSPLIAKCIISGNSAKDRGGGVFNYESSPILINCTFKGNSAAGGGGGMTNFWGSSPTLVNCTFSNNLVLDIPITGGGGGGMNNIENSNPMLTNCIFSGNSAVGGGGGMSNESSSPSLLNCIFVGNLANCGKGIINWWAQAIPTLTNCILWDGKDGNEICNMLGATVSITYSDVQGGWPGLGNIDTDPCFVEPGYWDANGTPSDANDDFWVNGDYHLKSEGWRWVAPEGNWTWDNVTSRCIDAGNPGSPLADELLVIPRDPDNLYGRNLRINMGTYGGTTEASMPPYDWAILADLTNDGKVDFNDLTEQVEDWLNSSSEQPGDLDRNGIIDMVDFALLGKDWLTQTTWHEP